MKQKFLLKTMLLLFALVAGTSSVWATDVTIWEEDWSGTSSNQTPATCTITGYSDITYTYTNGGSTTKTYGISSFTDPELLISKSGGALTVTIPASRLTGLNNILALQYDCNRSLSLTVTNGSLGSNTGSSTTYKYTITVTNISENLVIEFKNTGANARFSNVKLIGTTTGPTTYSVTYYANGATGDVPTDNTDYNQGDEVTVCDKGNLEKTGCYFDGWNTQENGSGTPYAAGASFNITANTKLYAQWTPYTITPESNDNNWGTVSGPVSGTATITAYPADGYRVVAGEGGFSVTEGSANVTNNGNNTFTVVPTSDCTVQINFQAIPTHTLSSAVSPAEAGTVTLDATSVKEGYTTTATATANSGYKFTGWSIEGTGASLSSTSTNPTTVTMGTANATVTANFEAVTTYEIKWSVNGEIVKTENVEENVALTFSAPASIPTGYVFKGWRESALAETTDTDPNDYVNSATSTANTTYYAVFAVSSVSGPTLTQLGSSATFSENDNIVIVAKGTTLALYQETTNTSYVKNWTFENNAATVAADSKKYLTLKASNNKWYLGDATNGYLYNGSSNNLVVSTNDNEKTEWTISWDNVKSAFKIVGNNRYLSCRTDLDSSNANLYRMGGSTTNTPSGTAYFDVYKFVSNSETFTHFCTTVEDYPVTVGSAGYTTYVTPDIVSFPIGVTAYIVSSVGTEKITLSDVLDAPAGTPLIIEAAEGVHYLDKEEESISNVSGNKLQASDGNVEGDGSTIYALGVGKTGANAGEVGFYLVKSGVTVPEGKAYIDTTDADVKAFLSFCFEEDATGIVSPLGDTEEGAIYNLAGQRLNKMQKGINIVNGKKVLK